MPENPESEFDDIGQPEFDETLSSDELGLGEIDEAEDDQSEAEIELEQEFSLDDLGRAYARAVGADPDQVALADTGLVEDSDSDPGEDAAADNLACPVSPKTIVESVLFVGSPRGEKLTSRKIASHLRDVSAKEVDAITKELNQEYENSNSPFRITRDGNDLQLTLLEEFEPIRQKFYGEVREAKLSQSVIDILSIVAYKQPIGKKEIEVLRGASVGSTLNQLVKRELLEIAGNVKGTREKLYQTTDRFLDLFGLESLADLPRADAGLELD